MSAGGADRDDARVEGRGLHTGTASRVRFRREPGPLRLRRSGVDVPVDELAFDGARRSTTASSADGRLSIATVEHLFAALAAASIRSGVVIEVEGDEIPLADGGAGVSLDALAGLGVSASPPSLVVARAGAIDVGASRYELRPPASPGARACVEVEVDFDDGRLERAARWEGDREDFRERIATARTFGFAAEVDALAARGLASHVTPESVVVIASDRILHAGRPFEPDEPARHKLLDLIGDLYAHGGPPSGSVRAIRPGHAATHEAMRRALAGGLLARPG